MNTQNILSDFVIYSKYARYLPSENRRETWYEIVERNKNMHLKKFPELKEEIIKAYELVHNKKVLPSMRSLQFAGKTIDLNPARLFNCSYLPIDTPESFGEATFLLLSGVGVGYSVQWHHINKLPKLQGDEKPVGRQRKRRYLIGDSIEGWADAIKVLVESYFRGKREIDFDYRDIRDKGELLITSGGKAPGSGVLKIAIVKIKAVLENAISERGRGTELKPIEAHDILCHVADAVLVGGIRRAAMISLFSRDDNDMLYCKSGSWWEINSQRGRANNSVVLDRDKVSKEEFFRLWKAIERSNCGEPAFFFTGDSSSDWGGNPCMEISLKPYQFCNLCEINASNIESKEDIEERVRTATFIGTLQASYTNFHFLREVWQLTTEDEALLGVSFTGIASGELEKYDLRALSRLAKQVNKEVAERIGIRYASRVTAVKPSGTTSLCLGTSSGIHAWFAPYYVRRVRVGKDEEVYNYLVKKVPNLIEDDVFNPHKISIFSMPIQAPNNAVFRDEGALGTLKRVKKFNTEWVREGHREGLNCNNVSCTVNIKEDEWAEVGEWMWENRYIYTGISVLPYDNGTYTQAPFEEITKDKYEEMIQYIPDDFDLSEIIEYQDNTKAKGEMACSGGACEIV